MAASPSRAALAMRLACYIALTGAVGGCVAAQPVAAPRIASFAPLVRQVLPAVVNIAVTEEVAGNDLLNQLPPEMRGTPLERQFKKRFGNRREQVLGAGSGFIVDPSGIIVTNDHVVGHAAKIVVSLTDGREFPARVLGDDELTDVAVIKVDAPAALPFVPWGDSRKTEVGDWILAAGNPFGLGGSITAGIVAARGRDIGAGPFDDFLQLDAAINPGNSGGPTFNQAGQVVGMNTAIVSPNNGSVGIGFAIPSEIVEPIVAELRAHNHIDRGWLGVSVEDAAEPGQGVAVASVEKGGPAAKAGMRAGDVVVAVNGDHIDTARGLIKAVAAVPPGHPARLSVRRGSETMEITVTVGQRPPEQPS